MYFLISLSVLILLACQELPLNLSFFVSANPTRVDPIKKKELFIWRDEERFFYFYLFFGGERDFF